MAQKRKSPKKKPAAKRPPPKSPAKQKIQPVDEILFRVEGKMSTFGGPKDTGMSAAEGLALFTPADVQDPKYLYLFLPAPPADTTGLGRRLNPETYYFACRWNYNGHAKGIFEARACARGEPCKWVRGRLTGVRIFRPDAWRFVSGISGSAQVTD